MGVLFDDRAERETRRVMLTASQVEVRKWAFQMAVGLPDNERNSMGGLLGAAKAIEEYVLHLADRAGKE